MNRTANVVRMQLVNRQTFLWLPLIILGSSFAITLAVYGIILFSADGAIDEPMYSGGVQAPLWYFLVVGIQAMSLTFPFSQAMSVTRREFFQGTVLTAVGTSLILAVTVLVGGLIEQATDGWGFDGYFFRLPWIWEHGPAAAALLYFSTALLAFLLGFLGSVIYKRFGLLWVLVAIIGLLVLLVIAAFVISATHAWSSVGRLLLDAEAPFVALIALGVGAVAAGLSYLALRRAIP
ncbi:MAG: hypothetical protein QM809_00515 [Gordonia sp. (in: high G+C Gram-positive bacteria)]|uniref:hypothetical protein n=1 Tax=Gordonia sp. (in: high G+C Gram-positive bacteria) TaxID=84139 RepID=UPI0039E53CD5